MTEQAASITEGTTIYVVDEQGATFAFLTPEDAKQAYIDERRRGAVNLTRFEVRAPRDGMSLDELADYAASHGEDRTYMISFEVDGERYTYKSDTPKFVVGIDGKWVVGLASDDPGGWALGFWPDGEEWVRLVPVDLTRPAQDTPVEVAITVESIINNGLEEFGENDLPDLTQNELVTLVRRVQRFVGDVR